MGEAIDDAIVQKLTSLAHVFFVVAVPKGTAHADVEAIREQVYRANPSVSQHRILVHTTLKGGVAILRQLQPDVHVEVDATLAKEVMPYLSKVAYVGPAQELPVVGTDTNKILRFASLHDIFACIL